MFESFCREDIVLVPRASEM